MNCSRPEVREKCRRLSCLRPAICPLLATDHGPLLELLEAARREPGVKQALVASGIRMDLALRSPEFIRQVARHHTGGLLKVAPEHTDPEVLRRMNKPPIEDFEAFARQFRREAAAAGKQEFLVPYFIAGHPGCDLPAMIDLALYLKRHRLRPDKVQDFIPGPMDIATCMYYTGLDPMSGEPVYVPRGARERRLQRALLQYFKPENYADVREALEQAGRLDLIGDGPECLIPSRPRVRQRRRPRTRLWCGRPACTSIQESRTTKSPAIGRIERPQGDERGRKNDDAAEKNETPRPCVVGPRVREARSRRRESDGRRMDGV